MLMQRDIDILMQNIQAGEDTYIYYVAHMVQSREGTLDEHRFKSLSQFKVTKVKVTDIVNAWFEYTNYVKNPDDYHMEIEIEYYDQFTKYIHYYTVRNVEGPFDKEFNPRFPSIIYGIRRIVTDRYGAEHDLSDASPVKEIYTNALMYGDLRGDDITNEYNAGNLNWKYQTLDNPEVVDGIEYKYVTSNYYILTLEDYPTIEKPLVYANQLSAYFMDIGSAFDYIEQLKA